MVNNIVIVGGGFAGAGVASEIEKALLKAKDKSTRIILVEKKTHFYTAIAGPRLLVRDWDNQVMIPYTNLFKNRENKVIQASAIQFEKDHVVLDREVPEFGKTLAYSHLLLCTGTDYSAPAKALTDDYESTHQALNGLRQQVKEAKSILIVGGGPVGIEMAGEIRDVYKDKKITLVHNKEKLLDNTAVTEKLRDRVYDLVKKNDIEVILNELVILPYGFSKPFYLNDQTILTQSGKKIEGVDFVVLAVGNRPGTAWLKNSELGKAILNPNGYVKVKDTFQVDYPGLENVYVLGDAADLKEPKMAYLVHNHTITTAKNVVQSIVQKEKPAIKYQKAPDGIVLTFGTQQGTSVLPLFGGLHLGSKTTAIIKSKHLFLGKNWSLFNAKRPALQDTLIEPSSSVYPLLITVVVAATAVAVYFY